MSTNTSLFIEEFIKYLSDNLSNVPVFYEEATEDAEFPYVVLTDLYIYSNTPHDNANFYLDVYSEQNIKNATLKKEKTLDKIRSLLERKTLLKDDYFAAHFIFNNRQSSRENDFDISHDRLNIEANIFYQKGEF